MADYPKDHREIVHISKCESDDIILQYGVRRGSFLGRRIFLEYAEDVTESHPHALRRHLLASAVDLLVKFL